MTNVDRVRGVRIVELGRVDAPNGSLTVAEVAQQVPFDIARFFTVFGVPAGSSVARTRTARATSSWSRCTGGSSPGSTTGTGPRTSCSIDPSLGCTCRL